jgi:hypothetical protein
MWVTLIMVWVKSLNYSILNNVRPQGKLISSRDIRQGDHLSPTFFYIMCWTVEESTLLFGVPITRGDMKLSHLFIANDSLLFCKANAVQWSSIQEMLAVYEKASSD